MAEDCNKIKMSKSLRAVLMESRSKIHNYCEDDDEYYKNAEQKFVHIIKRLDININDLKNGKAIMLYDSIEEVIKIYNLSTSPLVKKFLKSTEMTADFFNFNLNGYEDFFEFVKAVNDFCVKNDIVLNNTKTHIIKLIIDEHIFDIYNKLYNKLNNILKTQNNQT